MPERLVHRTWTVRTVSGPFPVPLFGQRRRRSHPRSSSPSRRCDRRQGAASGTAPSPPDSMDAAESDLSSFVRRSQPRRQPRDAAGYEHDDVHEGGGEDGGTYVALSWIRLPAGDFVGGNEEDSRADVNMSHSGRKRPRSQLTGAGAMATGRSQSRDEHQDEEVQSHHQHHHLHVHVWVRDEEAAQLVLCFANFVKEKTTSSPPAPGQGSPVDSFAYVLVRGSPAAYMPVLSWLEETSGCRVGPRPFRPTPADVGRAAADWTLLARRRLLLARGGGGGGGHDDDDRRKGGRNGGRETSGGGDEDYGDGDEEAEAGAGADATVTRMLRPLEVTFDAPGSVAEAGLEKITLTVPPTSLWRLCCAIEDAAPPMASSSGGEEAGRRFPILRALHSYFRESFRVDLSSFPLARAACSAAVIGRDGRFKPLDVGLVGEVLGGLRNMVEGRSGSAGGGDNRGVVGRASGRYDDEEDE